MLEIPSTHRPTGAGQQLCRTGPPLRSRRRTEETLLVCSHPTLRRRVDHVFSRKDKQGGQGTSPCPPCLITWSLFRCAEESSPSCDGRAHGAVSKYGNERGLDSVPQFNAGEIASAARRLTGTTVRSCSRGFHTSHCSVVRFIVARAAHRGFVSAGRMNSVRDGGTAKKSHLLSLYVFLRRRRHL